MVGVALFRGLKQERAEQVRDRNESLAARELDRHEFKPPKRPGTTWNFHGCPAIAHLALPARPVCGEEASSRHC